MASGKKTSKNRQGKYAAYQASLTWKTNAIKRITRHVAKHPNDEQALVAMKHVSYGRRDPKSREWTSPTKELAQLIKGIYGKCPKDVFHPNPLIANAELNKLSARVTKLPKQGGNLFTIKERVRWA